MSKIYICKGVEGEWEKIGKHHSDHNLWYMKNTKTDAVIFCRPEDVEKKPIMKPMRSMSHGEEYLFDNRKYIKLDLGYFSEGQDLILFYDVERNEFDLETDNDTEYKTTGRKFKVLFEELKDEQEDKQPSNFNSNNPNLCKIISESSRLLKYMVSNNISVIPEELRKTMNNVCLSIKLLIDAGYIDKNSHVDSIIVSDLGFKVSQDKETDINDKLLLHCVNNMRKE